MKTFDEALDLFYRDVQIQPGDDIEELENLHGKQMELGLARMNSTLNEVISSRRAVTFIRSMAELGKREANFNILVLALHAFAHGVAVGIEMERQDMPGFEEE